MYDNMETHRGQLNAYATAAVMSTPGISIDSKLVHTGGHPKEDTPQEWQ